MVDDEPDNPDPLGPEEIQELTDEEFEELVSEQLNRRRRDADVWAVLVSDAVRGRTAGTLELMRMHAQGVLERKNRDLEAAKADLDDPDTGGTPALRSQWRQAVRSRNKSANYARMISDTKMEVTWFDRRLRREKQAAAQEAISRLTVPPASATPPRTAREEAGVRRALAALKQLTAQVISHEDEMGDDPSQADEDLWDLLDDVTVVVGDKQLTLRRAHESNWTTDTEKGETP